MSDTDYRRGPDRESDVPVAPPRQNPRLSESTTREWVELARAELDAAGAPRQGPNPKREPADRRSGVEWAVRWHPHDGHGGGIECRADRDDADHLRRRYPDWPGEVVCRTVTVGEWTPVE